MAFTPLFPKDNKQAGNAPGFTPLGQTPPTPASTPAPSLLDKIGGDIKEVGSDIGQRFQAGVQADQDSVSGKINPIEAGVRIFGQAVGAGNDVVGGAVKAGLQTVNAATGGAAGNAATSGLEAIAKTPLGAMAINALQGGATKWQSFADKYPRAAQDLQAVPEAAQMILNFTGGGEALKVGKIGAEAAGTALKDTAASVGTKLADRSAAKAAQTTIDAVTPELKGTKLTQAYKDVVKGNRDIEPSGLLKQQSVTTSAREAGVGQRLFDAGISLQNKPIQDIKILRGALKDTEGNIEDVLKGDPEMVYNADKPTLLKTLNTIGNKMPEEFKAIKDSGAVFKQVLNYGKTLVGKTEDSITGLRNARTAFDAQAKIEFPSAFKEGGIDLKSPAGRAVKAVRDAINDHLYATAPAGSKIKELIGREADIFRATDAIAPRAAAGEGKNIPQKVYEAVKAHPLAASAVAYEGLKHTVVPQLPGL